MADNLSSAAYAAKLAEEDKKRVEAYSKSLKAHKQLTSLPPDLAQKQLAKYTPAQQASLKQQYGTETPVEKPDEGWLSTAWNYTGGAVIDALGKGLAGLQNVSDFSTRLARTVLVAGDQKVNLNEAWDIANDKGDKVFSPGRIERAKELFNPTAVAVAMRIASGEDQGRIIAEATPEQLKYLKLHDKTQGTKEEQDLFQDTMDAVNAAKYSPGRFIANIFTPEKYEGSGFFYKTVSGAVDAAYRVFADPLIVGGKAKKLYDISKYSVEVIAGSAARDGVAFAKYFDQPKTATFWNEYGAKLAAYRKADEVKDTVTKARLIEEMKILAPEFGPAVIQTFNKAAEPIEDVLTAKAFFSNAKQMDEMIKGAGGRRRIIAPRMTPGRKARVATLTTANKVFNIDKVGPALVNASFFGEDATDAGIYKAVTEGREQIVETVDALNKTKKVGVARFSTADINVRIDRFKQRFAIAPMFRDDKFDLLDTKAPEYIYRLARLVFPQREAKLAAEVFRGIDDVGQRKEFFDGIMANISDIRGINTTEPTQSVGRTMAGKGKSKFDNNDDALDEVGAFATDFNTVVTVPSLRDIDRLTARSTIGQKIIGPIANSTFLEKTVGYWSFLTLAGPRYAIRNSVEDLMISLAIGVSPWGVAKSRRLTTRVLTSLQEARGAGAFENLANSPLGVVMRIVNKEEAARYADEIKALDVKLAANKAEIKELRKTIESSTDEAVIAEARNRISLLRKETDVDVVRQTREIMASALTRGRVNNFLKSQGRKPMNEEAVELLTEQIVYGDIENFLSVISEGGFNFATGSDFLTSAVGFTQAHGVRSAELRIVSPKQQYSRAAGVAGFKSIGVTNQDEASLVSWLLRISYASNDELGAIAVANLDRPEIAIPAIRDYLSKNPDIVNQSLLKAKGISIDEHARLVYDRTRKIFETRRVNDEGITILNEDLLNKVRTLDDNGEYVVSGKISLDDLRTADDMDLPRNVIGPQLVPVTNTGNMGATFMENGWRWLGMANARMSRQPIVVSEMLDIRRQMRKSGFEDAWIASYTKGINPAEKELVFQATEKAKRDLATVVEERAIGQTLAYIDNPLVRSQMSFSIRNFARFYRATEDFYRRVGRAVRYNPESIAIAALTYEGITHSGFVQEDDQGEKYFIYPGIEPVYNAMQKMLDGLGIGSQFRAPMPIQFGAQVKMLTPSLNPDSLVPTFAGPVAGISIKTLESIVNIFNPGAADTITRYTLGKYAVDQPITSAFLPAHVNRLIGAMDRDERDSQYASAHRKAVTYLEAAGHGIPKRYDEEGNLIPPSAQELEEYRLMVKNTTLGILGMRFVFGFFAPASPQIQLKSDMNEWVRDNGRANFKQLWNDLKEEYVDYDDAMKRWVELYPNQIPFTVPESERSTVASFGYAEEAGKFVEENENIFKEYPQAAAFLIPNKGGFSWDAYKTMTDMGLRKNQRVEEHLRKIQTAADLQSYYDRKDEYELGLESAATDYTRSKLRKEFSDWRELFFAGRPLAAEELNAGGQKEIERINALNDLESMLANNSVRAKSPETFDALKKMLDTYLEYKLDKERFDRFGGSDLLARSKKDNTIIKLKELSQFNENTLAAYDSLFGRLLD